MDASGSAVDCELFFSRREAAMRRWRQRSEGADAAGQPFDKLRRHMLSLMEGDVALMHQLVALRQRVDTLRADTAAVAAAVAAARCADGDDGDESDGDSACDDDDDAHRWACAPQSAQSQPHGRTVTAARSTPSIVASLGKAVSRITVNDSLPRRPAGHQLPGAEADPQRLSRRYFSRQNSVLRIPIAPSKRRSPGARGCPPTNRRTVDFSVVACGGSTAGAQSHASWSSSTTSGCSPRSDEDDCPQSAAVGGRKQRPVSALVHLSDASVDSGVGRHSPKRQRRRRNADEDEFEVFV